jgi:selenocysteine-specific elongation factor
VSWVQLHLAEPVALVKNDRFIIRFPSPSITVGGGTIVDPNSATRHRRFKPDVIQRLETLAKGTPDEIVLQFLATRGMTPTDAKEIASGTGQDANAVTAILKAQTETGGAVPLGAYFIGVPGWRALTEKIVKTLEDYHRQYAMRAGLPREELKSRLGLPPKVFDLVVERAASENGLVASQDLVRRPDFAIKFSPEIQRKIDALIRQFEQAPYTPPSAQEAEQAIGAETIGALVTQDKLVRLNESVLLLPKAFAAMRDWVIATIQSNGQITAGEVRDHFNTSRKYAIALLEYLDDKRVTKRMGDARVLR